MGLPTNCFIYAFSRWMFRGGYLILRRSRSGPFPHFMWTASIPEDLPVEQYLPKKRRDKKIPPVIFDGEEHFVAEPEGDLPSRSNGIDWSFLLFWVAYFACIGLLAIWLYVALGPMVVEITGALNVNH